MTDEERLQWASARLKARKAEVAGMGGTCSTCRWKGYGSVHVNGGWAGFCTNPLGIAAHLPFRPVDGTASQNLDDVTARGGEGFCGPRGIHWEEKLSARLWPIIEAILAGLAVASIPMLLLKVFS